MIINYNVLLKLSASDLNNKHIKQLGDYTCNALLDDYAERKTFPVYLISM